MAIFLQPVYPLAYLQRAYLQWAYLQGAVRLVFPASLVQLVFLLREEDLFQLEAARLEAARLEAARQGPVQGPVL
jgi:hypothetical protein